VTTFAFLSYFAMATGDGVGWHTTVLKAVKHNLPTELVKRQVFWARYIDWALTTPLLLLDLSILAGLSGANILVAIIADVIMVLTGLFAAFGTHDGQKWGWYAWACLAFLTVVYQVGYNGRFAVSNRDRKTKAFFAAISLFTLVLWAVYPIIWAIGEGSRIINVDSEIIAYAVLDILAKPVFGFWLLLTHDAISRTTPSIDGFWSQGLQPEGTIRVGEGRIRDDE
jgi:bacteriorhodopsin